MWIELMKKYQAGYVSRSAKARQMVIFFRTKKSMEKAIERSNIEDGNNNGWEIRDMEEVFNI